MYVNFQIGISLIVFKAYIVAGVVLFYQAALEDERLLLRISNEKLKIARLSHQPLYL